MSEVERLHEIYPDKYGFFGFIKSHALTEAIIRVHPATIALPYSELDRMARPTDLLYKLKLRFWTLQKLPPASGKRKDFHSIRALHEGICSYQHLNRKILMCPFKVAWIIKPSESVKEQIQQAQHDAASALLKIVQQSVLNKSGGLNVKSANLVIKSAEVLIKLKD